MAPANGVVSSKAMPMANESRPTELFLPVISKATVLWAVNER